MKIYHLKNFAQTNEKLSVQLQIFCPGESSGEHLHDCVEMMYILSGSGVNFVNRVSYPIVAGDLYVIRQGQTHFFHTDSGLKIYNLMFRTSIFSRQELRLFRQTDGFADFVPTSKQSDADPISKLFLPPPFFEPIKELFELLHRELKDSDSLSQLNAHAHLIQLLCRIFSIRKSLKECRPNLNAGAPADDALAKILSYLNRNFLKELSVHEIASHANLSPTYIGEFFQRKTGTGLVKYINTLRIEKARMMLADTELGITEIAEACGFKDSSYFTRLFRAGTGFSPSKYRMISGIKQK